MSILRRIVNFFTNFFSLVLSIKFLTWVVLVCISFISLFSLYGAVLTNNVLAVILMLLLLTLFSDLKEFNFWGLWGKKMEIPEDIKNAEAISGDKGTQSRKEELQIGEAERQPMIQLMDTDKGNFLYIVFEIERLMRIAAQTFLERNIVAVDSRVIKELQEKDFLTEKGVKQYEALRWLRNIYVHGKDTEVTPKTLTDGIALGLSLHQELYNWLYPDQRSKKP